MAIRFRREALVGSCMGGWVIFIYSGNTVLKERGEGDKPTQEGNASSLVASCSCKKRTK